VDTVALPVYLDPIRFEIPANIRENASHGVVVFFLEDLFSVFGETK